MKRARRRRSEHGAAIVETIFAMLLLLFVMFGMVELARMWFTQQLATAAVREAVRVAAVAAQADVSTVGVARINAVLAAGGITAGQIVNPAPSVVLQDIGIAGSTDKQVVASVNVQFKTVFPLLLPSLNLDTLIIPQTAAMRWEGSGT